MLSPGDYAQLYVDEAAVGCGYRRFIVREVGQKIVRLFEPYQLRQISVDVREAAKAQVLDRPRGLRQSLRERRRLMRDLKLPTGGAAAREVLDLLKRRTV